MEKEKEQTLTDLVGRLQNALNPQLISVVLYGSAASEDWDKESSDLNVLCILQRISVPELRRAEPVWKWWAGKRQPFPLLLTEEEVRTSSDAFPMEFRDMQEHRRVLYGPDLIGEVVVDNKYYRAQVEHELRAKQLRLRQRAAEVASQPARLQRLMVDSVSTFCVLGRHALILHDSAPRWRKKEVVGALATALGRPMAAINEILAIRTSDKPAQTQQVETLFERYLDEVSALVEFVDRLKPEGTP